MNFLTGVKRRPHCAGISITFQKVQVIYSPINGYWNCVRTATGNHTYLSKYWKFIYSVSVLMTPSMRQSPICVVNRPLPSIRKCLSKNNWRVRFLNRFWTCNHFRKINKFPFIRFFFFGPSDFHNLNLFIHPAYSYFKFGTMVCHLFYIPTDLNTKQKPTRRKLFERDN